MQAVALFGSLIMPHNIYLHSALVQSRKLMTSTPGTKREALVYFGIESALSLVVRGWAGVYARFASRGLGLGWNLGAKHEALI